MADNRQRIEAASQAAGVDGMRTILPIEDRKARDAGL
mgnify:CR=1 FL=1